MEVYNSVQKVDQNGAVYRGVAFSVPLIRKGKRKNNSFKEKREYSPKELKDYSLEELKDYSVEELKRDNENKERAIRRAKSSIRDYVKTNVDLNYFVTYTLDPKIMDRYDSIAIYSRVRDWLSNRVRRNGFKYILVPEKHKDGAWHFHGFVNVPLEWAYGYSVCKPVPPIGVSSSPMGVSVSPIVSSSSSKSSRDKCINYMVSYVKKNMEKFNGRYYLHSKNLDKPVKIYGNVNFGDIENCYCMELEGLGVKVKIWDE